MNTVQSPDCSVLNVFGVDVRILSESRDPADSHVVTRLDCAPGIGAPPHRHAEREAFYILSGEVTLTVDGSDRVLRAGDFLQVEPDTPHHFRNSGGDTARIINLSQPAGHGDFFRAAHALHASGRFTPENAVVVSREHGIEILRAPGT
ncbi:MAG: cupin domain-containing protein [Opitutales bacterium]|nr:cupin domain-containing protein [Opitutales bacterium]